MKNNLPAIEIKRGAMVLQTGRGIDLHGLPPRVQTASGAALPANQCKLQTRRLEPGAVEFWIEVANPRPAAIRVREIRMLDAEVRVEGTAWEVKHSEMFKCEYCLAGFSRFTGGGQRPLRQAAGEYGWSEDLPFPGIFFTHPERGTLLLAALTQDRCKPVWRIAEDRRSMRLVALDAFTGIPAIPVPGRTTFNSERWVAIATSGGVDAAVDQYFRLLQKRIDFPGATSILREAVVWGSWNYNPRPRGFWDVSHDYATANARALRRLVPDRKRVVMVDDGYQRGRSKQPGKQDWFCCALNSFYPPERPAHDAALFPQGMPAFVKTINRHGCIPAIWVTARLHRQSTLAKAHPDWLVRLAGGREFGPRSAYLDYSLPEVREFTRSVWRRIIDEWGFRGIKLDFWTLPFEIPAVRYRGKDRTAIELRNQFLSDLREFIPNDGFILTAVAVNAGNPFPGRFIDAARNSDDISSGKWLELWEVGRSLAVASRMYRHDCLLADADSFACPPWRSGAENRLAATLALMTGAVCEIGGDLTRLTPHARQLLRTAAGFFKPALRTRVLEDSGGRGAPPGHLLLERADGIFEAYLNWSNYPMEIRLSRPAEDLWTGQKLHGKFLVPGHDAVLFRSAR